MELSSGQRFVCDLHGGTAVREPGRYKSGRVLPTQIRRKVQVLVPAMNHAYCLPDTRDIATRSPASRHIEQTQSREPVLLEQLFVDVLLEQLVDLRGGHLASIGSQFAVRLCADADQVLVGRGR